MSTWRRIADSFSPPRFAESKMRVMRIRKMITLYISSIIAGNTERRFDSNLYDRVVGIRSSPLCVKRTKRRRRWRTGLFRKHATRKRRGGTWEEREHRGRERESKGICNGVRWMYHLLLVAVFYSLAFYFDFYNDIGLVFFSMRQQTYGYLAQN